MLLCMYTPHNSISCIFLCLCVQMYILNVQMLSLPHNFSNVQTVYHSASLEIATRLLESVSVLLVIVEQTAV